MMRSLSNIVECNVSWRTHSTGIRNFRVFLVMLNASFSMFQPEWRTPQIAS